MKNKTLVNALVASGIVLGSAQVSADYASTWILERVIVTGDKQVFDSELDDHIQVGGILKIVNDSYKMKGLICDQRINECVRLREKLTILALDEEGHWADAQGKHGEIETVHIVNRRPDTEDNLNLLFSDGEATVLQSFRLIAHNEQLPEFEFENGVGVLEGKMVIEQMGRNHGY